MSFRRATKLICLCAVAYSRTGCAFGPATSPRWMLASRGKFTSDSANHDSLQSFHSLVVLSSAAQEVEKEVETAANPQDTQTSEVVEAMKGVNDYQDSEGDQVPWFETPSQEEVEGDEDPEARSVWSKEDLIKSEWKIAVLWEGESTPQETWIRFVDDLDIQWGLNARGTWELSGQYLSFSRDFKFGWGGKRIFGAKLSRKQNEVFIDGLVRGWTPLMPAAVMGQFQAVRLGVDRAPYGTPYWNTEEYELEEDSSEDSTTGGSENSANEEEPEPFWTGLVDGASGLGNTLFPPGTPTAEAFRKATQEGEPRGEDQDVNNPDNKGPQEDQSSAL